MARQHSVEFKLEIVRQLQSGEKRLAQICREHNLDAKMVREWRDRVAQHGPGVFTRSKREGLTANNLASAQARIADLERLLKQLMLENAFLKGAVQAAEAARPPGGDAGRMLAAGGGAEPGSEAVRGDAEEGTGRGASGGGIGAPLRPGRAARKRRMRAGAGGGGSEDQHAEDEESVPEREGGEPVEVAEARGSDAGGAP